MKKILTHVAISRAVAFCVIASAIGCASGAKVPNMIPTDIERVKSHPYSARVQAAGGRGTEWWGTSQVTDEAFLEALYESLSRSGVFSEVVTKGAADYLLDVFVTDVRQPVIGFNMTVSVVANWTLTDLAAKEVVFEELIPTPYTATVGDAFAAIKRLRLANEGAVRANIRAGIRRISELNLEH